MGKELRSRRIARHSGGKVERMVSRERAESQRLYIDVHAGLQIEN
jgi:hypothetical protein